MREVNLQTDTKCPEPCEDAVSRKAAIDALDVGAEVLRRVLDEADVVGVERAKYEWGLGLIESYIADVNDLPSAEPEITDEQAIEHLQASGWMQNHDREIYESGLKERLADDSGDYDSLIPCEDAISRQAAIDALHMHLMYRMGTDSNKKRLDEWINNLPSAQPERTCVNCGRTANNGGWYADGRTRCPIEEHYALPKDGYCHLWEKRNVTDDDYPERRTDDSISD